MGMNLGRNFVMQGRNQGRLHLVKSSLAQYIYMSPSFRLSDLNPLYSQQLQELVGLQSLVTD